MPSFTFNNQHHLLPLGLFTWNPFVCVCVRLCVSVSKTYFKKQNTVFFCWQPKRFCHVLVATTKLSFRLQQYHLQACLRNGSVQKHQGASLWDLWFYWDSSLGGQWVLFVCAYICVSVEGQSKDSADRLPLIFLVPCLNGGFIVRMSDCVQIWNGQGAGVCRRVWKCWLFTNYSRVFNFAGEQSLGGLFKGSILFKNPGFVWHLVLILLVYIYHPFQISVQTSLAIFSPVLFLSLIFLYLKRSFHYSPSLPHRKSHLI